MIDTNKIINEIVEDIVNRLHAKHEFAENIKDNKWIKQQIAKYYREVSFPYTVLSDDEIISNIHSLNEIGMNRLIHHMDKTGIIIISACRSSNNQSENNKATRQLNDDIKRSGYSYTPVFGGYAYKDEKNGKETTSFETSFVVYNYRRENLNNIQHSKRIQPNFNELKHLALELCKKYYQECVYIHPAGEVPYYYDQNGNKISNINDLKSGINSDAINNVLINRVINSDGCEGFTALKKKFKSTTI